MAVRNIRQEGDELLKKKSREVEEIDEKIQILIQDMLETMKKYNGVGLAAVQVGILKRIIVIDLEDGTPVLKLVNPKIISQKGEQELEEGCLSFPGKYAKVIRPKKIVIEALNEKGEDIKIEAEDMLAQAISHEMDHLEGVTFVEKMLPGTLEYIQN